MCRKPSEISAVYFHPIAESLPQGAGLIFGERNAVDHDGKVRSVHRGQARRMRQRESDFNGAGKSGGFGGAPRTSEPVIPHLDAKTGSVEIHAGVAPRLTNVLRENSKHVRSLEFAPFVGGPRSTAGRCSCVGTASAYRESMRSLATFLLPLAAVGAACLALVSHPKAAGAEGSEADKAERAERCATRLSIAMLGDGATPDVLGSADPQAAFDGMLKDTKFIERFSRFINSQFNMAPGATAAEDASYYLTKHVLEKDKPWTDMFLGPYDVVSSDEEDDGAGAVVRDDPEGLGYFRSRAWMVRYAGNEPSGMRIVAAYRMMWNTIGLTLTATTNAPEADLSATGRQAGQCAGCHFQNWYALDKVAAVLGTKTGTGARTRFAPPTGGPQEILGGVKVSNDKELVEALVANEAFSVNACRLAYKFLYGRAEYSCEGPVFDRCVDAFKKDKRIQSALASVAKDPSFCE